MRLGIGLPSFQGNAIEPATVLEFARRAEAAGFDAVAVHDRPNHETWDPLMTLAAVAPITNRVRLATTAILLPTRDETLLVKQAALVDRLSNGRLDLGLAVGGRADDFEALDRSFAGRGRTFERQLARLDELWARAVASESHPPSVGPAPVQRPRPRTWIGGYAAAAPERATRYGDAFIFGAAGIEGMGKRIPEIRAAARTAGKNAFEIGGLAYVVPSTDPSTLNEAEQILTRYYGHLHKPFGELVHTGDTDALTGVVDAYRATGLDVLYLLPIGPSADVVDRLSPLLRREATAA